LSPPEPKLGNERIAGGKRKTKAFTDLSSLKQPKEKKKGSNSSTRKGIVRGAPKNNKVAIPTRGVSLVLKKAVLFWEKEERSP